MGRQINLPVITLKENYDLVIETIKGKPELVCKYCYIIIPLKKTTLVQH